MQWRESKLEVNRVISSGRERIIVDRYSLLVIETPATRSSRFTRNCPRKARISFPRGQRDSVNAVSMSASMYWPLLLNVVLILSQRAFTVQL